MRMQRDSVQLRMACKHLRLREDQSCLPILQTRTLKLHGSAFADLLDTICIRSCLQQKSAGNFQTSTLRVGEFALLVQTVRARSQLEERTAGQSWHLTLP